MGISLKELKKNRLTPAEKWLLETIEGCEPEKQSNGDVYWYKDSNWLFQQDFKNGLLGASFCSIWSVLEEQFGLNDDEIKELINNVMYDYTNNGSLTPTYGYLIIES